MPTDRATLIAIVRRRVDAAATSDLGEKVRAADAYHAAAPDILAALHAQEWRAIETAPRDGTEVIGWHPDFGQIFVSYDAQWQHGEGSWLVRTSSESCVTWTPITAPICWFPLPPEPDMRT